MISKSHIPASSFISSDRGASIVTQQPRLLHRPVHPLRLLLDYRPDAGSTYEDAQGPHSAPKWLLHPPLLTLVSCTLIRKD